MSALDNESYREKLRRRNEELAEMLRRPYKSKPKKETPLEEALRQLQDQMDQMDNLRRAQQAFNQKSAYQQYFQGTWHTGSRYTVGVDYAMPDSSSHYKVLGIEPGASKDDVRRAYRKKAMEHHPDRGGDVKEFQKVQEAWEALR